jgi:hypothetical protein
MRCGLGQTVKAPQLHASRSSPSESSHQLLPKIEALKAHISVIRANLKTWDEEFLGELEKCISQVLSPPFSLLW